MFKRVLVTGGAGFIGSAVVRKLVGVGTPCVVNVDALTYAGNLDSLLTVEQSPSYHFVHLDIADGDALGDVFANYRPEAVMHLAAESHVDRSIDTPAQFVRTNVDGTRMLLEVSTRYWRDLGSAEGSRFRFLHVSTDEVYGSVGAGVEADERARYAPNSPYAATKAAADHLVRAWHHTYGLPVVTTNCSNNFGPFQFPEKLIPHVILQALSGKPIPLYGDGKHIRDWIFVDDHVDALRAVLERGRIGEVYNIGARCRRDNLTVIRGLCVLLDELRPREGRGSYVQLIRQVDDRPGHDRRYAIDSTRIETELGWKAVEPFERGLRKTVEWYLVNQWWWDRVLNGSYRLERIGLEV